MNSNYLFGKKALLDAINNDLKINHVYLSSKDGSIISELKKNQINFEVKDSKFLDNLANNSNHQGVVFTLKFSNKAISINELVDKLQLKTDALVLILDEIQDVGNLGAILRSADAFAVDAIIYKKNNQASPFNEVVIKTSTNAVSYLTLCETPNLSNAIEKLKSIGFWVYASCLDDKSVSYKKVSYANKSAIVIGNEQRGVSPLVIKNSDVTINIPQFGHVQSLNVSVATGILLSEFKNKI